MTLRKIAQRLGITAQDIPQNIRARLAPWVDVNFRLNKVARDRAREILADDFTLQDIISFLRDHCQSTGAPPTDYYIFEGE